MRMAGTAATKWGGTEAKVRCSTAWTKALDLETMSRSLSFMKKRKDHPLGLSANTATANDMNDNCGSIAVASRPAYNSFNVGPQEARHPPKRDTLSLTYNFNNFSNIILK